MMATSNATAGREAADELYRQLRQARISHALAFRAAVERYGQFCPDTPPAKIEAAVWQLAREQVRNELNAVR